MIDARPTAEFLLPAEARDALLRYLVGRPYMEVAEGIAMLQGLSPVSRDASQDPKEEDAA